MTEPAVALPVPSYGVIDHYLGSKGEQYFNWQGRPGILQGRWNRHLWAPHIRSDDDVLDFGCGGGFLLRMLDARARIGVEVNPAAARRARSLGIVTYTTLAEVPGTFDRIITSHVLEHIPHPRQALVELRDRLRDAESRLLILLPLDDWRNRANRRYARTEQNQHLHAWTPQTLGNLLASSGLDVLDVQIVREAWPPGSALLWKISPGLFRAAARVWARVARRYQLFAMCRLPPAARAAP